jgi:hypothetical protein
MNKYPITHNNKNKEETIIRIILDNNNYPQKIIQQKQKPPKQNSEQKRKWATFTFFGPETGTVTKLFKNTEIGISYRTRNNIKHLVRTKENNNGIYHLQCADCSRKYVGQTTQTFRTRFKEHIRGLRSNG